MNYGIRLPGVDLPRAHGVTQRRNCLEALALWH
jgi:hypothetical protein